jgi:hypothetical protein
MQDVLPPSIHPETKQEYEWGGSGNWTSIPEIPSELLEFWLARLNTNGSTQPTAHIFNLPVPDHSGYISPQATVIKPLNDLDIQTLRSALLYLKTDDRGDWIKIGLALKPLGDIGRGLWLDASATSDKFNPHDAAKTWESFNPTAIDYRFVFAEAQRRGWLNPAKRIQEIDVVGQCTEILARPLPPTLKPVPALDPEYMPEALRDAVIDLADRLQCPMDYLFVSMLSAAGAVVGNRVGIFPYANDESWEVYPALWGGIVGDPGSKKTPALTAAHRPLRHLESEAAKKYAQDRVRYEQDLAKHEQDVKVFNQSKKQGMIPQPPVEPKRERYIVNDTTYQALGVILADNPRGVLAFGDELSGLLQSLDTVGQEAARGFYLSGWSGTGSYSFDRIGRGAISLDRYCLSVFGGFQPDKIKAYVQFSQRGSSKNDGLLQRFQLLVWPDQLSNFTLVDRKPDQAAIDKYHKAILELSSLPQKSIYSAKQLINGSQLLHFDTEAQQLFNSWYVANENLLSKGTLDTARQSHFAKYRSLVPALALLFHLLDGHSGAVCSVCLGRTLHFSKYLKKHADRIYASGSGHDHAAVRTLANRLLDKQLVDGFTCRTLTLKGWSGLATKEQAQSALDALVEYGWLIEQESRAAGRPTIKYQLNPNATSGLS